MRLDARLTKNLRRSVLPGTYCVVQRISRFGNRFSPKNAGKNLDDNEEMTIFGITIEQFICCKLFIVRKSQLLPQWRINRQDRNARSWLVRHNLWDGTKQPVENRAYFLTLRIKRCATMNRPECESERLIYSLETSSKLQLLFENSAVGETYLFHRIASDCLRTVSYTHLTLPTIA